MIKEPKVSLFHIAMCVSDAIDLVSPALANHHKRVAYIAMDVARRLRLGAEEQADLVLAGLLHDIGALSVQELLNTDETGEPLDAVHAERGFYLLRLFQPLERPARLVRYHHASWEEEAGNLAAAPFGSHVLHLADRVAGWMDPTQPILPQAQGIRRRVAEQSGALFGTEVVRAFDELALAESFWLDAASQPITSTLFRRLQEPVMPALELDLDGLLSLGRLFAHIIDFRSRFTATHSSGVAATAETLAEVAGFSARECRMMRVAGFLHDLGKLAVPAEILEKPAGLTPAELFVIRSHTYYTYVILETIRELDTINTWAAFHHERLDGAGYPFRHKGDDLVAGARIMAVADVFTAITEDRPYRAGMSSERTQSVLLQMAASGALDARLVNLLIAEFDRINGARVQAQLAAAEEYKGFMAGVPNGFSLPSAASGST